MLPFLYHVPFISWCNGFRSMMADMPGWMDTIPIQSKHHTQTAKERTNERKKFNILKKCIIISVKCRIDVKHCANVIQAPKRSLFWKMAKKRKKTHTHTILRIRKSISKVKNKNNPSNYMKNGFLHKIEHFKQILAPCSLCANSKHHTPHAIVTHAEFRISAFGIRESKKKNWYSEIYVETIWNQPQWKQNQEWRLMTLLFI